MHYNFHLKGGTQFRQDYDLIEEWVNNTPNVSFDRARSITYLNGRIYFHTVEIFGGAEATAFLLKFAEHVYPVYDKYSQLA